MQIKSFAYCSGLDFRPQVVCIEFNPTIPNRVSFIQDADMRIYQGSSLLALTDLALKKGYTLIGNTFILSRAIIYGRVF